MVKEREKEILSCLDYTCNKCGIGIWTEILKYILPVMSSTPGI